jgi:P27 family predicted phage terminase small subunit
MGKRGPIPEEGPVLELPALKRLKEPPAWLSARAKQKYNRIGRLLVKAEVLTETDMESFALMWKNYDVILSCAERIEKEGESVTDERGQIRKHPLFSVYYSALKSFNTMAASFAMTPEARKRLRIAGGDSKELTTLEKLLD